MLNPSVSPASPVLSSRRGPTSKSVVAKAGQLVASDLRKERGFLANLLGQARGGGGGGNNPGGSNPAGPAGGGTSIGDGTATLTAAGGTISGSAAMMNIDAAFVKFPGVLQVGTIVADTVVGSSYTPGAGNIW